ncbi:hypothetical protein L798_01913 [Zootermopsis nevadensis]|uniref:Uncharacterized protein n=1 Tax=Zootermopsis nevadensis TaxID=136037 RepID=A0A067QSA1_ZOONE|nr:hypothetical protein L798_01913 [Zootermopsis nevadensis]
MWLLRHQRATVQENGAQCPHLFVVVDAARMASASCTTKTLTSAPVRAPKRTALQERFALCPKSARGPRVPTCPLEFAYLRRKRHKTQDLFLL